MMDWNGAVFARWLCGGIVTVLALTGAGLIGIAARDVTQRHKLGIAFGVVFGVVLLVAACQGAHLRLVSGA